MATCLVIADTDQIIAVVVGKAALTTIKCRVRYYYFYVDTVVRANPKEAWLFANGLKMCEIKLNKYNEKLVSILEREVNK